MPEPSSVAYPSSFKGWSALVCRPSVLRRGLKFAVVVGTILIAINHGDAILADELTTTNYLQMGMTVVVPFVVSVLSSVGVMLEGNGPYRGG